MPSAPGAINGVPSRIESTKFCMRIPCGLVALSTGMSMFHTSGFAKPLFDALLNAIMSESLRVKETLLFSRTILPRVPLISKRFVPGASPVDEMNTPVALFAHSR